MNFEDMVEQEVSRRLATLARRAHCREDHDMLAVAANPEGEVSSDESAQRVLDFVRQHPATSLRAIGDELSIGRQTALNAIRRLRFSGALEVTRMGSGRSYPTTYRVLERE